jgi:hypothetical protein
VSNQSVSKEDTINEASGFTSLNKPFCESKNTELAGSKKPALEITGKPVENNASSSSLAASKSQTNTSDNSANSALENENEDVSSEAEDIREQAKKARDPESGENIL